MTSVIENAIAREISLYDDDLYYAEECVFTNRKTPAEHIRDNDDIRFSKPVYKRTIADEVGKLYRKLINGEITRIEYCKQVKIWDDVVKTELAK